VTEHGRLSLNQLLERAKIEWHGVKLGTPDWSEHSHSLAFTLQSLRARFLIHGMLNAFWEPLTFALPPVATDGEQHWRRCIDTARQSPDDFYVWEMAPLVKQATYLVQPRSTVILVLPLQAAEESAPPPR